MVVKRHLKDVRTIIRPCRRMDYVEIWLEGNGYH